jgi:2-hydroxychromene-2-carboxylate isomerase
VARAHRKARSHDRGNARIADPAVKAKLRANCKEAIAAKVFGVPSLVIDGTVFWGQDATDMAMDFILHREHFEPKR